MHDVCIVCVQNTAHATVINYPVSVAVWPYSGPGHGPPSSFCYDFGLFAQGYNEALPT